MSVATTSTSTLPPPPVGNGRRPPSTSNSSANGSIVDYLGQRWVNHSSANASTEKEGGILLRLPGLQNNVAMSMDECVKSLLAAGKDPFPGPEMGLYCNATWDSILCWPATPANSTVHMPCPPLKGLDPTQFAAKACDADGSWSNEGNPNPNAERSPNGYVNYSVCVLPALKGLLNKEVNEIAQDVAKNARKLEFVGLGLSLVSLLISIFIFSYFRRLRVFRNMLHLNLMVAILMVVVLRLVLYIDLIFTDNVAPQQNMHNEGYTINTMSFVCEFMYFMLEYFKTVAFMWMFLEGLFLHNTLVFSFFSLEPKLRNYMLAGYGIPLLHTGLWLGVVAWRAAGKVDRCLGSYYIDPAFWILDGPRMLELIVNFLFICNVIRVLWMKVRESHNSSEMDRMKKSVKAALMLIPLLGIPDIMQTIPLTPTEGNIMYFAIWTYCASFTYMYQGLMVTIIYCFTNKEVNTVIKAYWSRYKLQHQSGTDLRRGSRGIVAHYQTRSGSRVTQLEKIALDERPTRNGCTIGGGGGGGGGGGDGSTAGISVGSALLGNDRDDDHGQSKKGSTDSTTRLMFSLPPGSDETAPLRGSADSSAVTGTAIILEGNNNFNANYNTNYNNNYNNDDTVVCDGHPS